RRSQARELAQTAEVLRHGLDEIAAVAPEPGEDDALDIQAKRLGDADALRAAADEARLALVGDVTGDFGGEVTPQDATAALAVAGGFSADVGRELAGRAMKSARVSFAVDSHPDDPGPEGVDEVALLLAAHPGAPPRPVHRGASGGELSRVMLAIEVVFADADP